MNKALAQSVQGPSLFLSEDSDTSENIGLASSCFSDILNFSYSRDIVGFGGLETLELSNNLTRSRSVCEIESVSRIKPIFKTVNSKVTHNSSSEKQRHMLYDLNCLNNLNDYSKEDIKLDYVKTRILVDTKGENLKEKDDKEDENRILNDRKLSYEEHKKTDPLWKTKLCVLGNIAKENDKENVKIENKGEKVENLKVEKVTRKLLVRNEKISKISEENLSM